MGRGPHLGSKGGSFLGSSEFSRLTGILYTLCLGLGLRIRVVHEDSVRFCRVICGLGGQCVRVGFKMFRLWGSTWDTEPTCTGMRVPFAQWRTHELNDLRGMR